MAPKYLLASVAAVGLMAQPALAQNQKTSPQPPVVEATQQKLAQVDIEFATEAAQGGLKEVKFGELAQQQATHDEVKQFAKRMVQDHGEANDELKEIAEGKAIELPQKLPDDAQRKYDELQQKSGDEFDQAYMDDMVSDHRKDVAHFQEYVDSGQDPDLTKFAAQTLPVLKQHLQLAEQTQQQVSAAAQEKQPSTVTQGEAQQAAAQPEQAVSIEKLLGAQVVNSAGDEVAKIDDVVRDQDGEYFAVLEVGGFLGIGDKEVAVPLDHLQLGDGEAYLMSAETEEELKQMPAYDENQYQPHAQQ
jgi:putative membrane protein